MFASVAPRLQSAPPLGSGRRSSCRVARPASGGYGDTRRATTRLQLRRRGGRRGEHRGGVKCSAGVAVSSALEVGAGAAAGASGGASGLQAAATAAGFAVTAGSVLLFTPMIARVWSKKSAEAGHALGTTTRRRISVDAMQCNTSTRGYAIVSTYS